MDLSKIQLPPDETRQELDQVHEGVYVFISFDLDNSTKFKTLDVFRGKWGTIIHHFYSLIEQETKKEIKQAQTWKHLGDEVLFYIRIENHETVYDIPEQTLGIQAAVLETLKRQYGIQDQLSIKSTLWIGGVRQAQNNTREEHFRNIYFENNLGNKLVLDFIGEDIDIGFRVAKHAFKGKVTLSAEFAYLLHRMGKPKNKNDISGKLKIVAYQFLKGVWDERAYPVVWYGDDWLSEHKGFQYDDHMKNEVVKSIYLKPECKEISELERIFEETGRRSIQDQFNNYCESLVNKEN